MFEGYKYKCDIFLTIFSLKDIDNHIYTFLPTRRTFFLKKKDIYRQEDE